VCGLKEQVEIVLNTEPGISHKIRTVTEPLQNHKRNLCLFEKRCTLLKSGSYAFPTFGAIGEFSLQTRSDPGRYVL
jgi:hypothetical protein